MICNEISPIRGIHQHFPTLPRGEMLTDRWVTIGPPSWSCLKGWIPPGTGGSLQIRGLGSGKETQALPIAPGTSLSRQEGASMGLWEGQGAGPACYAATQAPEEGAQLKSTPLLATPSPGCVQKPNLCREVPAMLPRSLGHHRANSGWLRAPSAGSGPGRFFPVHQRLPRACVPDGSDFSLVQSCLA